jgi:hypothetical protein
MTLYRFYIINENQGLVQGTDDNQIALDMSHFDYYFVIDTKTGKWLIKNKEYDVELFGDY